MNNIAEILTGYDGKGIILYSPLYGNVELLGIQTDSLYPIVCRAFYNDDICQFSLDGRVNFANSECLLYPSKDQRDWNKFKEHKDKSHKFNPFDKVLVRNYDSARWKCELFSYTDVENRAYVCVGSSWRQCIPYEGNEHLLGTVNKS